MKEYKSDYINYRIAKCKEALSDALLLVEEKRWNAAVNRLYYSCFYIVSALLLKNDIEAKTHAGVKGQFNLLFVKKGLILVDQGRLFADLFDSRQRGDYGDLYDFEEEVVKSLVEPVKKFVADVEHLIGEQIT